MPGWVSSFLELLIAAGAGGIAVQYIGKGPERRAARAEVRKALGAVQERRWNTTTENDRGETFRQDLARLMTAAMVAQVPRRLIDQYVHASRAVRAALTNERRREPAFSEFLMYGLGELGDYFDEVGNLLVDYLWRPWLERARLKRRLDALEEKRKRLAKEGTLGQFLRHECPGLI
jgi:hypothetical protein